MAEIKLLDRGYSAGTSLHVLMEDGSTPWAEVISAENHPTARHPQNWHIRVRIHLTTRTGGFRDYNLSAPGGTASSSVVVLIED
ncbi:MAG: hypothetical protein F4X12_20210 [Acidobacteriia bacterium]|nr:hypothetical protein [Terriglobia bacterium]